MRQLIILCAVAGAAQAQQPISNADLRARADSFVSERVAADAFSGAVLVARRGGVVYERAAGMADREAGTPIALDTKLQIASATKLFTHIAIRQLEQAGKLSLADTVGKFLPGYPNPVVRSKVTVEQLLRHRSGIGSFWNDRYRANLANIRSTNDYLELFQSDELLFEPGTSEAYSNGGYVVLGAIIERLTGKSYHDYIRENIFRVAGMTNTVPYDRNVHYPNAALGYTRMTAGGPASGGADQRLAGPGPGGASGGGSPSGGARLRLRGPDGRELSQEEAQAMRARMASAPRRSNADTKPGLSGPAGDHFMTVGDFLKLATAITSHRLLDEKHTGALLGARYTQGNDLRANGGSGGVNAEFSIYPTGDVIAVISNYDPPAATDVAQFIRGLVRPASGAAVR
jgi:CubicO group peptidase (beta-lactamase class C family)